MYNPNAAAAAGAASGGGALASTGSNSLWLGLAAFALIAVGAALLRIIPAKRRKNQDGE